MLSTVARRTATRAEAAILLILMLNIACGPSKDKAAPAVLTEPARTTTTNPYAIPPVLDATYVNRVLAGLDAAVGDIVRLVIRTKTISPEALDRMKAVYADPNRIQRSIDGFQRDILNNFKGYTEKPGNKESLVIQLITASPECIFARVHRDYSAVSADQSALRNPQWVGLKPTTEPWPEPAYNPTRWTFVYDGFPADTSATPSNPCLP